MELLVFTLIPYHTTHIIVAGFFLDVLCGVCVSWCVCAYLYRVLCVLLRGLLLRIVGGEAHLLAGSQDRFGVACFVAVRDFKRAVLSCSGKIGSIRSRSLVLAAEGACYVCSIISAKWVIRYIVWQFVLAAKSGWRRMLGWSREESTVERY